MSEQEYLDDRIQDQIDWYSKKSGAAKRWYQRLKALVIIISACIPVIAIVISDEGNMAKIIVGIFGVLIVVLEGMLSHYKFKDIWLEYRMTSELLNREKLFYLTNSGPYKKNKSFQALVERAEAIMGAENQSWLTNQRETTDESPDESSQP